MQLFIRLAIAILPIFILVCLFAPLPASATDECWRIHKTDFDNYPRGKQQELVQSQNGVFTDGLVPADWKVAQDEFTTGHGHLRVSKGNGGSNPQHFFQLNFVPAMMMDPHYYWISSDRVCDKPQYQLTQIDKVFVWDYAPQ